MKTFDFEKVKAKIDAIGEGFANREAKIGFFPDQKYPYTGVSVAYVAAIQEFGSPENGIPSRPFMRPTVEDKKGEWAADLANGIRAVVRNQIGASSSGAGIDDVLDIVGRAAVGDIQKTIAAGDFKALSPITLMLRKMRDEHKGNTERFIVTGKMVGEAAARVAAGEQGSTRTAPLDDTGYLMDQVRSQVGDAS